MISIIMPSLNPDLNKIQATLCSIFRNNGEYEVVLILQKTSSVKIEYLYNYFKDENKLCIIRDEGIGISRARNLGIYSSKGSWILLLDDDIYIEDSTICALENVLADNELFYYGNAMITSTQKHYMNFPIVDVNLNIWNFNRVCSITLVINRKVFEKIGYFDEQLGSGTNFGSSEESDLIIRALLEDIKIRHLKNYKVYHEEAIPSFDKIEKYAIGVGALYKKHLSTGDLNVYAKLVMDLIIRFIFLFTFKKRRYFFFKGFFKGFYLYRNGKKIDTTSK